FGCPAVRRRRRGRAAAFRVARRRVLRPSREPDSVSRRAARRSRRGRGSRRQVPGEPERIPRGAARQQVDGNADARLPEATAYSLADYSLIPIPLPKGEGIFLRSAEADLEDDAWTNSR